jgi:hypothetical protein
MMITLNGRLAWTILEPPSPGPCARREPAGANVQARSAEQGHAAGDQQRDPRSRRRPELTLGVSRAPARMNTHET